MTKDKTKLAIIGHPGISSAIARTLANRGIELIQLPEIDNSLEINGVKYTEKPRSHRSHNSDLLAAGLLMTAACYSNITNYTRERPQVDIIEEFRLIQAKQSKLSRNDREWVVQQFNSRYKPV